jgi:hypothetical protein
MERRLADVYCLVMTMTRLLLLAAAAMAITLSVAEARNECRSGWFFIGVACTPEEGALYAPYYGSFAYYSPGYFSPTTRHHARRPVGNNGAIYCMLPGYTWQNGECQPYRGN